MIKRILKKGIPFGIAIGLFSSFLDYLFDGITDFQYLLNKHGLSSLIFGIGFGLIVVLFEKRQQNIK